MYILEPGIRNWHWGTSIPLFGWPRYCWLGIHSNAKRYSAPRNTSSRNVLPPSSVLGGNRPPCSRISLPLALSLSLRHGARPEGGAAAPAEKVGRGGSGGEERGGSGREGGSRLRPELPTAPSSFARHGRRRRASPAMDAAVELPPWSISHPAGAPFFLAAGRPFSRPAPPSSLRPAPLPSRGRHPFLAGAPSAAVLLCSPSTAPLCCVLLHSPAPPTLLSSAAAGECVNFLLAPAPPPKWNPAREGAVERG